MAWRAQARLQTWEPVSMAPRQASLLLAAGGAAAGSAEAAAEPRFPLAAPPPPPVVDQKRMQRSAVPPPLARSPCACGDQARALTAAVCSVKR